VWHQELNTSSWTNFSGRVVLFPVLLCCSLRFFKALHCWRAWQRRATMDITPSKQTATLKNCQTQEAFRFWMQNSSEIDTSKTCLKYYITNFISPLNFWSGQNLDGANVNFFELGCFTFSPQRSWSKNQNRQNRFAFLCGCGLGIILYLPFFIPNYSVFLFFNSFVQLHFCVLNSKGW